MCDLMQKLHILVVSVHISNISSTNSRIFHLVAAQIRVVYIDMTIYNIPREHAGLMLAKLFYLESDKRSLLTGLLRTMSV